MTTEDDRAETFVEKLVSEKPSVRHRAVFDWVRFVSALVSLASVVGTGIVITRAINRLFPIPDPYYGFSMVLGSVLWACIGLVIVFSLARDLYRRQVRYRQLTLEKLRETEKEFFETIESDIQALLEGGMS